MIFYGVHPPSFGGGVKGVEPHNKFLKLRGLAGSQFLEGFAGKEKGVTLFRRGCSFYIKMN